MRAFSSRVGVGAVLAALLLAAGTTLVAAQSQGGHGQHGSSGQSVAATPEQQAAAARLVADVRTGIARWAKVTAGQVDGFQQSGPFRFMIWGPAHFSNAAYIQDGKTLDPQRPEGLVYMKLQTGEIVLLGAQFKALKAQGPRPGGPLTVWHSHECLGGTGRAGRSMDGQCPPGTTFVERKTEALHVWTFDNPDGPFAHGLTSRGIEAAVRQFSGKR